MTPDWQARYQILREALLKIGYPEKQQLLPSCTIQDIARMALVESRHV